MTKLAEKLQDVIEKETEYNSHRRKKIIPSNDRFKIIFEKCVLERKMNIANAKKLSMA